MTLPISNISPITIPSLTAHPAPRRVRGISKRAAERHRHDPRVAKRCEHSRAEILLRAERRTAYHRTGHAASGNGFRARSPGTEQGGFSVPGNYENAALAYACQNGSRSITSTGHWAFLGAAHLHSCRRGCGRRRDRCADTFPHRKRFPRSLHGNGARRCCPRSAETPGVGRRIPASRRRQFGSGAFREAG